MGLVYADSLLELVWRSSRSAIQDAIQNAPTIDAVPVVRCKDCKWRGKIGCAVIIVDESDRPKDDDFCSWGERRENADS